MRARLTTDRGGVGREEMICFERQEIVVRCKTPLMVGILFNVPIPSPGGNTGPRHILRKHSLRDRSSLDRIITKKCKCYATNASSVVLHDTVCKLGLEVGSANLPRKVSVFVLFPPKGPASVLMEFLNNVAWSFIIILVRRLSFSVPRYAAWQWRRTLRNCRSRWFWNSSVVVAEWQAQSPSSAGKQSQAL